MAAIVPIEDLPSLPWLLKVLPVSIDIIVNVAASLVKLGVTGIASLQAQADSARSRFNASLQQYNQLAANNVGRGMPTAAMLAQAAQLQVTLFSMTREVSRIHDQLAATSKSMLQGNGLQYQNALFATTPLPAVAQSLDDDVAFARWRVAGPNPMLIAGVTALPPKFPLTNAQYRKVMGNDDDLALAGSQHRLYLLDYAELAGLARRGPAKFGFAPIALFAIPRNGGAMMPVAIQCGQESGNNLIFLRADRTADASDYWAWRMAKTCVQIADTTYHEVFVHLGRTHLVSEAFCVATHRELAPSHPLNVLLVPHFEGTLFINSLACFVLIAKGTIIDNLFSGPIETIQQTAGAGRLAFDFYANMLPTDLNSRRVDNRAYLPDYPYRDDALLVWKAIQDWVCEYLGVYYQSDYDVTSDAELANWVRAVADSGKIRGFRSITSLAQLADVVTMIVFTASAQHAAVNFPQKALMAYPPAFTASGWSPAPSGAVAQSQQSWERLALPPLPVSMLQIATLELLGGVYHTPLGEYRSNLFPFSSVFTDPRIAAAGGPLQRFQASLKAVEATINDRNRTRPQPYDFLLPSRIPCSTNI
ncbi:lipoxygenase family protein [Paraburkholderia phymatum]|uniref:lipoxygenase family protein n=1 Tax=Paraburkholderia phymatum TaxID=148447 RepID=UPI00316CD83F